MHGNRSRAIACALTIVLCCLWAASGEKVVFRDELTGCQMWRLTDYSTFHEYCHAAKPFSCDGRRVVCRQWFAEGGVVVVDLADGSQVVFGTEHAGWKENPAFVRGRNAVVYIVGRQDASVFLYDLDTGQERRVVKLKGNLQMPCAAVVGPRSEYLLLRGDLTGEGLSDLSIKPLGTDEPARAIWSSATCGGYPNTVSPSAACNRLGLSIQIYHPEVLRRLAAGKKLTPQQLATDADWRACIAVLDMDTGSLKTYPAKGARIWVHEAWSGDGQYLHMGGYSWPAGNDAPSEPVRIGDSPWSDHYGTCGRSGRYVVGDSEGDGMERLELTDLWTGQMRTVAYISPTTEPAGKIAQDHGHPAGSPDGTKVLFHSCYDLLNHRLYAIPTDDVRPGDPVIPVETTEGFAPKGKLLIGHGYVGQRMAVSYERIDGTRFHGCDWGPDAAARLRLAIRGEVIPKGSHHVTDAFGRLAPDGTCRPRKEYVAVVKQPDPPRALRAARNGQAVRLTWDPPASHEEVAGYVVWRRRGMGMMERLTAEPIAACEYTDKQQPPKGKAEYFVRAVEHSGLYGACSSAAWVDAEGGQAGVELVDSYDVPGSAYVTPGRCPIKDRRQVRVRVPLAGQYVLWVRGRAYGDAETLHVRVDGEPLPDAHVAGTAWHWVRLASCRLSEGEHVVEVAREQTGQVKQGNLLANPSFEDGLAAWTYDRAVTSVDDTRARSGKQCVRLSGMLTGKKLLQTIDLKVKPEWAYRFSLRIRGKFTKSEAKRYHGTHPNTLGRIAMLLEPLPYPKNWYRNGNQFDDQQWQQVEMVFNTPPTDPGRRLAEQVDALPFWCPGFWGEQVGTVWIDDVEVVELGPRLRPVKVTKLLVTNLPGYKPMGPDGREAYRLSHVPLITVTGLRQTGEDAESISLAWDAGRPGTLAYNIYLHAGSECPTTKYLQNTSVWGKTAVTIPGLAAGTSYTVEVTAINEDSLEGPAATIRAATQANPLETQGPQGAPVR
jgi:hypothetical protein